MGVCAEGSAFTALKVTTDLVDGEITTAEEFVTNHNTQVIDFLKVSYLWYTN